MSPNLAPLLVDTNYELFNKLTTNTNSPKLHTARRKNTADILISILPAGPEQGRKYLLTTAQHHATLCGTMLPQALQPLCSTMLALQPLCGTMLPLALRPLCGTMLPLALQPLAQIILVCHTQPLMKAILCPMS
jgi:hypothetical protein